MVSATISAARRLSRNAPTTTTTGSADRHAGHVADADGRPTAGGDDDLLDVAGVVQRPEPAHDVLLLAVLDVVAAGVRVGARERLEHLAERDAARLELLRVDLHLE